jgi:hypothetical protein
MAEGVSSLTLWSGGETRALNCPVELNDCVTAWSSSKSSKTGHSTINYRLVSFLCFSHPRRSARLQSTISNQPFQIYDASKLSDPSCPVFIRAECLGPLMPMALTRPFVSAIADLEVVE